MCKVRERMLMLRDDCNTCELRGKYLTHYGHIKSLKSGSNCDEYNYAKLYKVGMLI